MIASRWPESYCVVYLKIFIIKCLGEKMRGKCAFHSMSTGLLTRSQVSLHCHLLSQTKKMWYDHICSQFLKSYYQKKDCGISNMKQAFSLSSGNLQSNEGQKTNIQIIEYNTFSIELWTISVVVQQGESILLSWRSHGSYMEERRFQIPTGKRASTGKTVSQVDKGACADVCRNMKAELGP